MASPNLITTQEDKEREEGFLDTHGSLSLNLKDEDILDIIGSRVEDSEKYWNSKLNLDSVRKEVEERWKNNNLEASNSDELYDFQVPYKDNRIFLSVETLASQLSSKIPEPVITEAQDNDASRELAYNYGLVLYRKAQDLNLVGELQMVARHLLMGYRIGVMKYYWDYNAGRLLPNGDHQGDVVVKAIRPHKIVIDANATDPSDVDLIAEYKTSTIEELCARFDDKKDEIWKESGIGKEDRNRFSKPVGYLEVWFSYWDKDQKKEGVAWKMKNILLDAAVNPNFNYTKAKTNFFDQPQKPYVLFNFLRTGRYAMDDTSLTEQAATLQDVLEKRGRQIVENADQAASTKVFNTNMIDAAAAQKFVGDPRQSILVKGDVRMAFKREAPALLPSYVLQDKYDARAEIDNIFGTHAPLRGEKTESPTLGQEMLSQRSDLGRLETLSMAVEAGAEKVYWGMTQIYKVYAKAEHIVKYVGEDGQTTFVNFNKDKIEDGMEIRVQSGSMRPDDKGQDRNQALEMVKVAGRIDPLTLAEKLHWPQPRKFAKRLVDFLWRPDRYMQETLGEGNEQEGTDDVKEVISRINSGENLPGKESPSKEYIAAYKAYLKTPAFKQLTPEIKQLHLNHLRETIQGVKGGLGEKSTEKPIASAEAPAGEQPGIMQRIAGLFKPNA